MDSNIKLKGSPSIKGGWLGRKLREWNLSTAVVEFRNSVRTIGWCRTFSVLRNRFNDVCFDLRYGTRTVATHDLKEINVIGDNQAHGQRHQPSASGAFDAVCALLKLPKGLVMVDFGSGLGRVLLLAIRAGFSKAIGVEFSPDLVKRCRENIAEFKARTGIQSPVEVHEQDAVTWIVQDDIALFYFFHPFGPSILRPVMMRIRDSLERKPRQSWLVYYLPQHEEVVLDFPEWVVRQRLILAGYPCTVFECVPGVPR